MWPKPEPSASLKGISTVCLPRQQPKEAASTVYRLEPEKAEPKTIWLEEENQEDDEAGECPTPRTFSLSLSSRVVFLWTLFFYYYLLILSQGSK